MGGLQVIIEWGGGGGAFEPTVPGVGSYYCNTEIYIYPPKNTFAVKKGVSKKLQVPEKKNSSAVEKN